MKECKGTCRYLGYESKKQLLDTLNGIVEYDTTFDNYYETMIEAINTGDGETLKEGITDLRGEIQQNQKYAQQLIEELTKLRDSIGHDVRAFGSNKELLQSILKIKVQMLMPMKASRRSIRIGKLL